MLRPTSGRAVSFSSPCSPVDCPSTTRTSELCSPKSKPESSACPPNSPPTRKISSGRCSRSIRSSESPSVAPSLLAPICRLTNRADGSNSSSSLDDSSTASFDPRCPSLPTSLDRSDRTSRLVASRYRSRYSQQFAYSLQRCFGGRNHRVAPLARVSRIFFIVIAS